MRKGQPHSQEARKKISDSMKGKKKDPSTKQKMSFAASNRWQKERTRKRKLAAIMAIGSYSEVAVEPANSLTEAFSKEGTPE